MSRARISLASPDDIRGWSSGEVTSRETHVRRVGGFHPEGLFSETIFGSEPEERRRRFGHIELATPVVHLWFFDAIANLLNVSARTIELVVYYQEYLVTTVKDDKVPLHVGQRLKEDRFRELLLEHRDEFEVGLGADPIRALLQQVEMPHARYMVLDCIPVVPPELRPRTELPDGRLVEDDLNELYRNVLLRNHRLIRLLELNAPEVIIRNERRMLQQAVDYLFDNRRCRRQLVHKNNRPLRSLTERIASRKGRIRKDLLNKSTDYSARSVVVPDPDLGLHQCAIPRKIADVLQIRPHRLVLLSNRFHTQAFEANLTDDKAIHLHPILAQLFRVTFEGEELAVHLPLSEEAQSDARRWMMSDSNVYSASDGELALTPTRDMALGCHHLTREESTATPSRAFADVEEVLRAHELKLLGLHDRIELRLPSRERITTTVGRAVFNDALPSSMPFCNETLDQDGLTLLIRKCHQKVGLRRMMTVFDRLKELSFQAATQSAVSTGEHNQIRKEVSGPELFHSVIPMRRETIFQLRRETDRRRRTRKLMRLCQHLLIDRYDCGASRGIEVNLSEALGRVILNSTEEDLGEEDIRRLEQQGLEKIWIRSPIHCQSRTVCSLCYGSDLRTGSLVEEGTAVGVIAALVVGELDDLIFEELQLKDQLPRLNVNARHLEVIVSQLPDDPRRRNSFLTELVHGKLAKVLTEAALNCEVDEMNGLLQNVLTGELAPVGSGYRPKSELDSLD